MCPYPRPICTACTECQHQSSVVKGGVSFHRDSCTERETKTHLQNHTYALFPTRSLVSFRRHTHPFNGPLSGTTRVSRYQKGKTNLDFTEARYSEWQWHPLGHMQVCISLQTDNHASTPPLNFLQAGCPSCRPTNSVKALVALVSFRGHTEKTRERSI